MSNIILPPSFSSKSKDFKWTETPAERSLRKKGHAKREAAILEGGGEFSTVLTRKENAVEAFKYFMRVLQGIRNAAADHKFDDERGCIIFAVQWRNNYEQNEDGEWIEMGSGKQWLDKLANQAKP
jgi:hypothetical protein